MADNAAGQITASLTLDISKFTKALGDAKKAVSDMQKTASQAASSGGGDAATESAKKAKKAADEQKQSIASVVRQYKNLVNAAGEGKISQDQLVKGMQRAREAANKLKSGIDRDTEAYVKLGTIARQATGQIDKVAESQRRAEAAAKREADAIVAESARKAAAQEKETQRVVNAINKKIKASTKFVNQSRGRAVPQADENKKLVASLALVSSSYNSLNRAIGAGVIDTKKAAQQFSKLENQLKTLETQVGDDQRAINALNSAMAASAGSQIFLKNQQDARMATEKLQSAVKGSTSKIGSFFKVMGTGIASSSRGLVMSLTNVTEAFQKGQMGGRMLSTFLLGDVMDAFMIGTFVTEGFVKSANSIAPAMKNAANMLMFVGRAFPFVAAGATLAAAAFGFFGFNQDKAAEGSEKAAGSSMKMAKSFQRAADQIVPLETNLSNASDAMAGFIERSNRLEAIELDKALMPTQALVAAVNELNNIKLTGPQQEARKIAAFFQFARENVDMLIQRLADLNNMELRLGGAEEARRLTQDISKLSIEIKKLEIEKKLDPRGTEIRLDSLRKEREILLKQRADVDNERRVKAEEIKRVTDALAAQEAMVAEQVKAEKKLKAVLKEISKAQKSTGAKKDEKQVSVHVEEMKEAIKFASQLRSEISKLEAENIKAGSEVKKLREDDPRFKQLAKTEKQIEELARSYGDLVPIANDYFESAPDDARRAQMAKEADELNNIVDLYRKAAKLGMAKPKALILATEGERQAFAGKVADRERAVDFLGQSVGGSDVAAALFRDLKTHVDLFGSASDQTKSALISLGSAAMTAAATMAATFGQAAMGNFGSFMSGIGGGAGAGIGLAMGLDPATGQAAGSAVGGFADMLLSKMQIPTGGVAADGTAETVGFMQIISDTFEQNLLPAIEAIKPFASVLFFVASRMGTLFGMVFDALGPVIDVLASLFLDQLRAAMGALLVFIPLLEMVGMVFEALSPTIKFLSRGLTNLLMIVFAVQMFFTQFIGGLIGAFASLFTAVGLWSQTTDFGKDIMELFNKAVIKSVEGLQGFLTFIGGLLIKMADELSGFFGDNPFFESLKEMGKSLNNAADAMVDAFTADLPGLGDEIRDAAANYRQQNENMERANQQASKSLNAPKGFKVEKYRYEAMNPERSGSSIYQSSEPRGGTTIVIENAYFESDVDLIERAEEAARRGGPSPGGGF